MIETPRRRAVAYLRISLDRDNEGKGVARQREDAEKLAANRGYELVCVYEDNDISASHGAERPDYQAMMKAARRGEFEVIVVWQLSRIWRNRRERAEGIEMLKQTGVSLAVCKGNDLDLSSSYGRAMADMSGVMDTWESEVKSERVSAEKLQALEDGRHSGGPRPFGWKIVRDPSRAGKKDEHRLVLPEVDEHEAEIIRQLAKSVLDDGSSTWSLAKKLNESGVRTARGARWDVTSVKNLLIRERNYGRVTIKDDATGQVLAESTEWPPILDEPTHRRLVTALNDPARHQAEYGGNRVKYLLSGIAVCGRCQAEEELPAVDAVKMGSSTASSVGKGGERVYRKVYRCSRTEHLFRSIEVADRAVIGRVFNILKAMTPEARQALIAGRNIDPELGDQAARLRIKIAELLDMWETGEISRAQHRDKSGVLKRDLARVEKQMTAASNSPALSSLAAAEDVGKVWAEMPLDRRRAVVADLVTVVVLPGNSRMKASRLGADVTPEQAGLEVTYNGNPADLAIFGDGLSGLV